MRPRRSIIFYHHTKVEVTAPYIQRDTLKSSKSSLPFVFCFFLLKGFGWWYPFSTWNLPEPYQSHVLGGLGEMMRKMQLMMAAKFCRQCCEDTEAWRHAEQLGMQWKETKETKAMKASDGQWRPVTFKVAALGRARRYVRHTYGTEQGQVDNAVDRVRSLSPQSPVGQAVLPVLAFDSSWTVSNCWSVLKYVEKCWKSAHTALAVKACLLGGNSNTKCSMTFVNIAVAISALAGGGGQKPFRTETRIRWCFRHFSRIFGCLSARGYWNGILGHFGSFPAMEKRPKMKKTLYIARFCRVFGCQSIENTAKTSVLDWRYSKKRVNYRNGGLDWKHYKNIVKKQCFGRIYCLYGKKRVNYRLFDWKHWKNTVKNNVLEGFLIYIYMLELDTGIGTWKNWRKHCK